ncbi:MAG: IS256 family transposase [Candidatus Rokuibacteriota bacterium]|nr:MAG: IS256 family transposase [Candidatus Rokubacteria bacterium]
MKRVPPSERLKEEITELLRGKMGDDATPTESPMAGFVRQVARYMLQVSLEDEATAFLGRDHYRRGVRARAGWRNGYEPKRVQSEAGVLELAVPQVRATAEPFRPVLAERLGSRTADFDDLVRGMYVRGLSTQDVSALYGETVGSRVSKSTVSRITQRLSQDFEAWRRRDLSELPVVYLFLDGQYHAARQGTDEKEGVLAAYALLEDGRSVLVHLDLGPRESADAWLSFLQDVVARGLREPLLVILDGAPGLLKAVKRIWPRAYRQRCQVHKMRNILAKLPRRMQAAMKRLVHQVFRASSHAVALKRGRDLIARFRDRYPAALECLERDLEECITYLRFPAIHHVRIRTTNRLERLNGEGRRRTKVIPRFPSERACLSLLYASLITASKHWRGIPMTAAALRQLHHLREAIVSPSKEGAVA